jgi:precorrin-6B methylase 2
MPVHTAYRRPVSSPIRDRLCGALLAAAAAMPGLAAEPRVPYVPTPQAVVDRMLEIAKVGSNDYLIDLGSGDGRIVITAAKKFGTRGFGVDIDPDRIEESNENARRAGVADRVAFYERDLFETNLAEATVITMYLLPQVNLELRPRLLALKPGTRIVSHDFSMDAWQPDQHVVLQAMEKFGGAGGKSDIYFWVVPALVAGRWTWTSVAEGRPQTYEVILEQRYQVLSGTARVGGRSAKLDRARVQGDELQLEFTIEVNGALVKHTYIGTVDGDDVSGSAMLSGKRLQSQRDWTAQRVAGAAVTTDDAGLRRYEPQRTVPY